MSLYIRCCRSRITRCSTWAVHRKWLENARFWSWPTPPSRTSRILRESPGTSKLMGSSLSLSHSLSLFSLSLSSLSLSLPSPSLADVHVTSVPSQQSFIPNPFRCPSCSFVGRNETSTRIHYKQAHSASGKLASAVSRNVEVSSFFLCLENVGPLHRIGILYAWMCFWTAKSNRKSSCFSASETIAPDEACVFYDAFGRESVSVFRTIVVFVS